MRTRERCEIRNRGKRRSSSDIIVAETNASVRAAVNWIVLCAEHVREGSWPK
jgi:hypothetical protein